MWWFDTVSPLYTHDDADADDHQHMHTVQQQQQQQQRRRKMVKVARVISFSRSHLRFAIRRRKVYPWLAAGVLAEKCNIKRNIYILYDW